MMSEIIKTGCVATVGILCAGLANFRKGGSASTSQKMMRMRVIAQGFTVAAFVADVAQDPVRLHRLATEPVLSELQLQRYKLIYDLIKQSVYFFA